MATNQMRREAAKRKLERQQERRVQQAARRKQVAVITSIAVAVLVVGGVVVLSLVGGGAVEAITPASIPTELAALPARPNPLPDPTACQYVPDGEAARPVQAPPATEVPAGGTVQVTLETSAGAVPLVLDRALAPCTVNSFVSLAQQGYFDDTPCHRLTTSPGLQVLQCGDPTGTGSGGPGYTVPDEFFPELAYGRGILAMANTGQPNSGGSQFFMVYGDGQLPPQYTAFGSISVEGLNVIDVIARTGHDGAFDTSAGGGKPVEPVMIRTASVG
ncbi:MAG: peptidylprolyl isomerase [Pseudonocardia sp.]